MNTDCISRQAVIDSLYDWSNHSMTDAETWHLIQVIGDIKSMPSVTPQLSSELEKNSKKLEKDFGESDCISRTDAIRVASGYCHPSNVAKELAKLPSVTPQEPRWIPTSERLPENKTYVLVTISIPGRQPHARSGWYQDGFFHNDNGDCWRATDIEVKAWMPLPEPFEPQESEG